MSFGFGVGDIFTAWQLAWSIYKGFRDAPEGFQCLKSFVSSLHAVLKDIDETVDPKYLKPQQKERLELIATNTKSVLEKLQTLIVKYQKLDSGTRLTWDRLKWHQDDVNEMRQEMDSNVHLLNTVLHNFNTASQIRIEEKLDRLAREIRSGLHQGSHISSLTADSLAGDERDLWEKIRRDMSCIGITADLFDTHKEMILEWFANAIATGAFEEDGADDESNGTISKHKMPLSREPVLAEKSSAIGTADDQSKKEQKADILTRTVKRSLRERIKLLLQTTDARLQKEAKRRNGTEVRSTIFHYGLNDRLEETLCALSEYAIATTDEVVLMALAELDRMGYDHHGRFGLLRDAVKAENYSVVSFLLANAPPKKSMFRYSPTALEQAVSQKNLRLVSLLLRHGADPNSNDHRHSLFPTAIKTQDVSIIRELLENGVRVSDDWTMIWNDGEGETYRSLSALYLAVETWNPAVVQVILDRKPYLVDRHVMEEICDIDNPQNRHWEIVDMFLRAGIVECLKNLRAGEIWQFEGLQLKFRHRGMAELFRSAGLNLTDDMVIEYIIL